MKKFIICLNLLVIIFCADIQAKATPEASTLYKSTVNSTVLVETENGSGSGTIISEDGTLVTCFHVVDYANNITVKTHDGAKYKVNGYRYINPAADIAILTLKTDKNFKPIKTNCAELRIGDAVYAISNPSGIEFVFTDGMISRTDKDSIQFTAPVSSGSSGGALLDKNGQLIGVISSQYDPSVYQNINFAIKVSSFTDHISDKKIINTKNMNWTDFIISKANASQLKQYRYYAHIHKNNYGVMYKYFRPKNSGENVDAKDYPFLGFLALTAYRSNNDKTLIEEVRKWFTLSILNNDEVELSSYGLFLLELYSLDYSYNDAYCYYLSKYPKTYKKLRKDAAEQRACSEKDTDCYKKVAKKIENNFLDLAMKFFAKQKAVK